MTDHNTQSTSLAAFDEIREGNDDVSLRKRVAAEIATKPATNEELHRRFDGTSRSSIRPRVNELLRMGCVKRDGTRKTASGNDAYVHHITDKGRDYLNSEVDPEPLPPLSQVQTKVVQIAREVVYGSTDLEMLESAVLKHDSLKRRRDPAWSPAEIEAAYLADQIPEHVGPKDNSNVGTTDDAPTPTDHGDDPTETTDGTGVTNTASTETDGGSDGTTEDSADADEHAECAGCSCLVATSQAESIKFIDDTEAQLCPSCHDEFDHGGL